MKGSFTAVLSARLYLKATSVSSFSGLKEEVLWTYPEVANYFLQTYANDDFIDETDAALTRFTQPPATSPTQCAEELVLESLRYGKVYDEYVLKGITSKGFTRPSVTASGHTKESI